MPSSSFIDYYEVLQISPRADPETVQRVFRHLAKRLHPDNGESGDTRRFQELFEAFQVLSNPEERAVYDATYERGREAQWRIFDQATAADDVEADRRVRSGILSVLYAARRNDPDRPGVGTVELERLLGCPEEHLKFHFWYLRESGWIQRLENGLMAITVAGVEQVMASGGSGQPRAQRLPASSVPSLGHAPAYG